MIRRINILLYLLFTITFQLFLTKSTYSYSGNLVELKSTFGHNKKFTKATELPALIALSFYPELKNTIITFEEKEIKTTMAARPHFGQLLIRDRSYIIYINNNPEKSGSVSFYDLGLNEQIGIIAHELSHIANYQTRKTLSMMKCGLYYSLFHHYHRALEISTDTDVIKRGLGMHLYAFSNYILNKSNATEEYKLFKSKNYLLPSQIEEMHNNLFN